jgi:hypothetical protein
VKGKNQVFKIGCIGVMKMPGRALLRMLLDATNVLKLHRIDIRDTGKAWK